MLLDRSFKSVYMVRSMSVSYRNKDRWKKGMKEKNFPEFKCDVCKSKNISETKEGSFVCRDCGILVEDQKLEYYKPYNESSVQNAVLTKTYIGYKNERYHNFKFERLNKLHTISDNKQALLINARFEISRILNALKLPDSYRDLILEKFKNIYKALNPSTKYRSPEKLVPLVIYFYFKFNNISISESELLSVSKISKKEFNAFKLQICNFLPQYKERNRQEYILSRILEITEHFDLRMLFYYRSKKLMYKLWERIKNTKDDVIAGLIASIIALCWYKEEVSVNAICKKSGIMMSTIQWQLKNRILEPLKITGFESLVKSSDLLKEKFLQMGLIQEFSNDENIA